MQNSIAPLQEEPRWYALWVYRSLVDPILTMCATEQIPTYRPMRLTEHFTVHGIEYQEKPAVPNLLFVRTTLNSLQHIQRLSQNRGIAYCYPGTDKPAPIEDKAMEIFMLVVKRGAHRVEPVEFPIDKGDKVRVIGGIFKGAEGYIRRVHGSRRFVVAIEGVVAIAVTHIPRQLLERIQPAVSVHAPVATSNSRL